MFSGMAGFSGIPSISRVTRRDTVFQTVHESLASALVDRQHRSGGRKRGGYRSVLATESSHELPGSPRGASGSSRRCSLSICLAILSGVVAAAI
jgi:hypothetical protein